MLKFERSKDVTINDEEIQMLSKDDATKKDHTEMIKDLWSDLISSEKYSKKFKILRPEYFTDTFINVDIDNSYTLNTIKNSTKNYLSIIQDIKSDTKTDSEKLKNYFSDFFSNQTSSVKIFTPDNQYEFKNLCAEGERIIPLREARDANDKMIQKSVNDLENKREIILKEIEEQIKKGSKGNFKIPSKSEPIHKVIKTNEKLEDKIEDQENENLVLFGSEFEGQQVPTKNRKTARLSSQRSSKRNSSNSRRGSGNSQSNKRVKKIKRNVNNKTQAPLFDFGFTSSKKIKEQPENE